MSNMFPGRRPQGPEPPGRGESGDEASEVWHEEIEEVESEGEGEDLLGDNMLDDYLPNPEQDQYDPELLDDGVGELPELTTRQRLAAERAIRERDAREKRGGRGDTFRRGIFDYDEDLL